MLRSKWCHTQTITKQTFDSVMQVMLVVQSCIICIMRCDRRRQKYQVIRPLIQARTTLPITDPHRSPNQPGSIFHAILFLPQTPNLTLSISQTFLLLLHSDWFVCLVGWFGLFGSPCRETFLMKLRAHLLEGPPHHFGQLGLTDGSSSAAVDSCLLAQNEAVTVSMLCLVCY